MQRHGAGARGVGELLTANIRGVLRRRHLVDGRYAFGLGVATAAFGGRGIRRLCTGRAATATAAASAAGLLGGERSGREQCGRNSE